MRKVSHEFEKLHLKICIVGDHARVCWYVFACVCGVCVCVCVCARARACVCICVHVSMRVECYAYKHKRNEPQRARQFEALTMQIILMELASVTLPDAARAMGFNVTASEET